MNLQDALQKKMERRKKKEAKDKAKRGAVGETAGSAVPDVSNAAMPEVTAVATSTTPPADEISVSAEEGVAIMGEAEVETSSACKERATVDEAHAKTQNAETTESAQSAAGPSTESLQPPEQNVDAADKSATEDTMIQRAAEENEDADRASDSASKLEDGDTASGDRKPTDDKETEQADVAGASEQVDEEARAAAEEKSLLEKVKAEMEEEEAAEAAREAEERAQRERLKAEKAAADKARAEKAQEEKRLREEKQKEDKLKKEQAKAAAAEAAKQAKAAREEAKLKKAALAKTPDDKTTEIESVESEPSSGDGGQSGGGKGVFTSLHLRSVKGSGNDAAEKPKLHLPAKLAGIDSDLEAKLSARRARADAGIAVPQQSDSGNKSSDTGGRVVKSNQEWDAGLEAKLSARRAWAEGAEEATHKDQVPQVAPTPPTDAASGSAKTAAEEGRSELVSFLADVGELPGQSSGTGPDVGVTGAMSESGEKRAEPELDLGAMMLGHGTLAGQGGGWDSAGALRPDAHATVLTDMDYLPMYHPQSTVGDQLLENIIQESLEGGELGGNLDVGAGAQGELERALAEALAGDRPYFDPLKDVPVNWGKAAAASDDDYVADAALLTEASNREGGLFGMKIGTIEVEENAQLRLQTSHDLLGERVFPVQRQDTDAYATESAMKPKALVEGDDVKSSDARDTNGNDYAVGRSFGMDSLTGGPVPFPSTGAQRRAMIAERERERLRQRDMAIQLAAVQREQAQARFAEYTGPPCGVGMALQSGTRLLMGTLRSHKRWVIEVDALLPDGPAARCGEILPGDVLLSVRESGDKDASAVGNKLEEAKALIMGPPGSVVILRFTRGETYQEHTHTVFEVSLVREAVKHPPLLSSAAPVEEEVDWALLPEQLTVEPGDVPLSLEGVPLSALSNDELQALLTGEEGKTAEMVVRKKDGSQARIAVAKKPIPRPANHLKNLLNGKERQTPAPEQRLMGSRTLAKLASAFPTASTAAPPATGRQLVPAPSRDISYSVSLPGRGRGSAADAATDSAGGRGSSSGWFGRVGGKVNELFGRVAGPASVGDTPITDVLTAAGGAGAQSLSSGLAAKASSSLGQGQLTGEGGAVGDEWVMLSSSAKEAGAVDGAKGKTGDSGKEEGLNESEQEIRRLLEEKRLPADVLVPRLTAELGVQSSADFGYLEPQDVEGLNLAPVLTRKLLEIIKECKPASPQGKAVTAQAGWNETSEETALEPIGANGQPVQHLMSTPKTAQLQAQHAQQFLQNREAQKRAREAELIKLQQSLHKHAPSSTNSDAKAATGVEAAVVTASPAAPAPAVPKEECKAIASYQAAADHEVTINAGEWIRVLRRHPSGWWEGVTAAGKTGWFPSTYVSEVRPIQTAASSSTPPRATDRAYGSHNSGNSHTEQLNPGSGQEWADAPAGAGGGAEEEVGAPSGGEAGDGEEEGHGTAKDFGAAQATGAEDEGAD